MGVLSYAVTTARSNEPGIDLLDGCLCSYRQYKHLLFNLPAWGYRTHGKGWMRFDDKAFLSVNWSPATEFDSNQLVYGIEDRLGLSTDDRASLPD